MGYGTGVKRKNFGRKWDYVGAVGLRDFVFVGEWDRGGEGQHNPPIFITSKNMTLAS
tara:strand:- start:838 stop:1008 length:171 start_codon:yes stop_codon:yes gene_type:complete